jgi:hypothetical protein
LIELCVLRAMMRIAGWVHESRGAACIAYGLEAGGNLAGYSVASLSTRAETRAMRQKRDRSAGI